MLQRGGGWCCDRLWLIYEPHYTLHSDPATARATLCICRIFLQSFHLPRGSRQRKQAFLPGQGVHGACVGLLSYMYTMFQSITANLEFERKEQF